MHEHATISHAILLPLRGFTHASVQGSCATVQILIPQELLVDLLAVTTAWLDGKEVNGHVQSLISQARRCGLLLRTDPTTMQAHMLIKGAAFSEMRQ